MVDQKSRSFCFQHNRLNASIKDDGYGTHNNQHTRALEASMNILHYQIIPNSSPILQNLDTHINGSKQVDVSTAGEEKEGMTDHFTSFAARVDVN